MGIELDDEFDLSKRTPEPRYEPIPDGDRVPAPDKQSNWIVVVAILLCLTPFAVWVYAQLT